MVLELNLDYMRQHMINCRNGNVGCCREQGFDALDVELLKLRVDRHDVLFWCIVLAQCDTQPYYASSLMTVEEVDADAMSRRDMYVEVGSCQRPESLLFFLLD